MDRLTKYQETEGGIPFVVVDNEQDALQRLARYEDIGTSEEFLELKKVSLGNKRESRWKGAGFGYYQCVLCWGMGHDNYKYCPHCGADMDI